MHSLDHIRLSTWDQIRWIWNHSFLRGSLMRNSLDSYTPDEVVGWTFTQASEGSHWMFSLFLQDFKIIAIFKMGIGASRPLLVPRELCADMLCHSWETHQMCLWATLLTARWEFYPRSLRSSKAEQSEKKKVLWLGPSLFIIMLGTLQFYPAFSPGVDKTRVAAWRLERACLYQNITCPCLLWNHRVIQRHVSSELSTAIVTGKLKIKMSGSQCAVSRRDGESTERDHNFKSAGHHSTLKTKQARECLLRLFQGAFKDLEFKIKHLCQKQWWGTHSQSIHHLSCLPGRAVKFSDVTESPTGIDFFICPGCLVVMGFGDNYCTERTHMWKLLGPEMN